MDWSDHTTIEDRGWTTVLATIASLAAALATLGIFLLDDEFGWHIAPGFQVISAVVLAGATVASAVPPLRGIGWLLLCHALGMAGTLFIAGFSDVGAIFVVPLILIGFALASWPDRAEHPGKRSDARVARAARAAVIAALSGALLMPASMLLRTLVLAIAGLVG